jgi:hypothetical protein
MDHLWGLFQNSDKSGFISSQNEGALITIFGSIIETFAKSFHE